MPSRSLPARAPRPSRVPADSKGGGHQAGAPDPDVALRLSIGREGIGLELDHPARLGCASVTELLATLPGMRFPVDVSGGVPRFRHRRGELQRLEIEVTARSLERWAAPRLRGLVGTRSPEVWVAVEANGATASVAGQLDAERGHDPANPATGMLAATPVLVFEVRALLDGDGEGDGLTLIVERARGAHLPLPATALAISCLQGALGPAVERQGALFRIPGAAQAVARALLPEAGARVPSADGMTWTSIASADDGWILHALHGGTSAAPHPEALRARELAVFLREADEELVRGDLRAARSLYLDALARAPGHAEIVRRLVEIDARAGGRAEAALAMLAEARFEGDARFGTSPGELRLEVGDLAGGLASLERAGETEPSSALAGTAYELAAGAVDDPEQAARWLDRALARAPRSISARWSRAARRVALGRLEDAMADVQQLEAMARGGAAKYRVWVRAGGLWQAAGLSRNAGPVYERALRFVPDEPNALSGLGVALVAQGRQARGVAVLVRALELAEAGGETASRIRLDLARALAEHLGDRPTAVAHVAVIPGHAPEAPWARGLEGRWRAALGDRAGATLAFARARDLAGSMGSASEAARAGVASLLLEAAEFERTRRNDPLAAQRHLAAALRLCPRDAEVLRAYRAVGEQVARDASPFEQEPSAPSLAAPEDSEDDAGARATPTQRPTGMQRSAFELVAEDDADPAAAARVEELTRRLQADPTKDEVADELASLLESLGRGHELLALVIGRLEDATPDRRGALLPRARSALDRLASDAERAGRHDEASLYREALDRFGG